MKGNLKHQCSCQFILTTLIQMSYAQIDSSLEHCNDLDKDLRTNDIFIGILSENCMYMYNCTSTCCGITNNQLSCKVHWKFMSKGNRATFLEFFNYFWHHKRYNLWHPLDLDCFVWLQLFPQSRLEYNQFQSLSMENLLQGIRQ